jgi:DnaK suppressor protein
MASNELFQLQLLELRDALRAQLATLRGGSATSRAQASADHFAPNQDSSAQTASEKALEFALDDHESTELRQVEAALQRIASGHYGRCVDCGADIPDARLHAAPAAERCIGCQEATEQR